MSNNDVEKFSIKSKYKSSSGRYNNNNINNNNVNNNNKYSLNEK